ncbi:hypothetical protein H0B56_12965 [Haloechinothrix sp. YIM 98757]|uniref:Uncharacterized protein n=1 Tax=Haloechinothrix aidingensis TaxID=2752311 RepID=A0A838AB40_9PSEU|nr:hypothetical protein [Haloechinothrix aidingensis]MBA0126454.1 hypothetical protein [Haloechinothrix aidingensis]
MRTVLILLAALTTLTACDATEQRWHNRDPLPACGDIELGHGERLRDAPGPEVACLERSLTDGTGAELTVSRPTVEGALIRFHYRATGDGTLEVYRDSTADTFGDRGWSLERCRSVTAVPEPGRCR